MKDTSGYGLGIAVAQVDIGSQSEDDQISEVNHRKFEEETSYFYENGKKVMFLSGGRSFFHGTKWYVTKPRIIGIMPKGRKNEKSHPKYDVRSTR